MRGAVTLVRFRVALVGLGLACVCCLLALVGDRFALVGVGFTMICVHVALILAVVWPLSHLLLLNRYEQLPFGRLVTGLLSLGL